eukprot:jgi/Mesvir1/3135/Mv16307-RA.2
MAQPEAAAVSVQKTLVMVNTFVVNTVRSLNQFSSVCERRLADIDNHIVDLEATLHILEAKLYSIEPKGSLLALPRSQNAGVGLVGPSATHQRPAASVPGPQNPMGMTASRTDGSGSSSLPVALMPDVTNASSAPHPPGSSQGGVWPGDASGRADQGEARAGPGGGGAGTGAALGQRATGAALEAAAGPGDSAGGGSGPANQAPGVKLAVKQKMALEGYLPELLDKPNSPLPT